MRRRAAALLLVALALICAKVAVGRHSQVRATLAPYDLAYVPRPAAVRWLSLGHHTLAADLYWLRTVQYMGDPRANARGWDKLLPVLDLVTDLDPRHGYAYQVGGNILASVGRVEESNRILEKGFARLPERYILPFHRGVNAFMYAGDYSLAGQWFERAARSPGAPLHMREAVMAMYVKGDQAGSAIRFLNEMLAVTEVPESRRALEAQLQQAQLEEVALLLDAAAETFHERFQRFPLSAAELLVAGLIERVPADPYGGHFTFDEEGRARSSVQPRRIMRPASAAERADSLDSLRANLRGRTP